jgi:epoxyqueuosine reductase QueG
MKDLYEQLEGLARKAGADFFGVADLAPAEALVRELGGDYVADYPRAISVGVAMPHEIVELLPNHDDPVVHTVYRGHSYDVINARLDQIGSRLFSMLQAKGHRAFPVRASEKVAALHGVFSNKLAAHLAGLGWIGKSCLLVTPERGPRVRWASVLTDAPLPTGEPMAQRCGDCTICVEACPPSAFTGRNFYPGEPRSMRFEAAKCSAYQQGAKPDFGPILCGMCVYACPHGHSAE